MTAPLPSNPSLETWKVGIAESKIRLLRENGDKRRLVRIRLVKEVCEKPGDIVHGWKRQDKDDCYLYYGSPKSDYRSATIETPAPEGMVFLVFVLPDGTIDDWNWRPASEDDPRIPEGIRSE